MSTPNDGGSGPVQPAQDGATPGYHAFLLRLWSAADGSGWHASLQTSGSGARLGFGDFEQLIAHLRGLLDLPGDDPTAD